jgi:hypothetical protein
MIGKFSQKCSVLVLVASVVSCGTETKVQKCGVTLEKTGSQSVADGVEASFRGTLPESCAEIISKTSNSSISLAYSGNATAGSFLKNLSTGSRSKAFGASYSLETGSLRTEFRSNEYKDWAFPWADKPTQTVLTVQLPVGANDAVLPASVLLEIAVVE